jgi:hypothetical protein
MGNNVVKPVSEVDNIQWVKDHIDHLDINRDEMYDYIRKNGPKSRNVKLTGNESTEVLSKYAEVFVIVHLSDERDRLLQLTYMPFKFFSSSSVGNIAYCSLYSDTMEDRRYFRSVLQLWKKYKTRKK